jgi:methionyl aminopeptidase
MTDELSLYRKSGEIAREVMKAGLKKIKPGGKLLDVAEYVEEKIVEAGAKAAFPCNISLNDVAAHYSPQAWDSTVFKKKDLVKLDIGVHLEGYIADIAKTVSVGAGGVRNKKLIKAAEEALSEAVNLIKPGVFTNEVGKRVEEVITERGFSPISNLTGHKLGRFSLHSGVLVPNIKTRHGTELREGDVYAIEPFATDGRGMVIDDPNAIIFRYLRDRPLRMMEARIILKYAKENYGPLPFAERWVTALVPRFKLNQALRQLAYTKALHPYHILKEKERGLVAQAEHTVVVKKNGCEVITS